MNQLIRKFVPKGRSVRPLTITGIQAIQDVLNQRHGEFSAFNQLRMSCQTLIN
ncbi:hypothetical protein Heal19_500041 (plasmid) [Lactiplantibacillus plantarum]|nr:hypothetical protein Heal19_500041 [Lactiplantibacillus plantarum]